MASQCKSRLGREVLAVFLGLATFGVTGCAKTPTIEVGLAPQLVADRESAPSVTVHLLGVSEQDLAALNRMSMTDYWDPSDPAGQRRSRVEGKGVKIVRLGSSGEFNYTLSPDDGIWRVWKESNAKYLVVLTDTPSQAEDQPGDRDLRRRVFKIQDGGFRRQKIHVQVSPTGLVEIKQG
jgi:hypothetical protein